MKLHGFTAAFDQVPPLTLDDITHLTDEATLFKKCLTHTILCIIIAHGGEEFSQFIIILLKASRNTPCNPRLDSSSQNSPSSFAYLEG
jgi:hypothetical protein